MFGDLKFYSVAQFGGVPGVTLAVNQHQRIPLMLLNHPGDAAEMLLSFLFPPECVLLSGLDKAHRDVVHLVPIEHHQCVGLLRVLSRALPH